MSKDNCDRSYPRRATTETPPCRPVRIRRHQAGADAACATMPLSQAVSARHKVMNKLTELEVAALPCFATQVRGFGKFVTPYELQVVPVFSHTSEAWLNRSKITASSAIFELPP